MAEVLELEKIETEQKQELPREAKDTWILRLPAETCLREGLAEGTMISLTVKNHGIQATFIRPNPQAREAAQRFIEKHGDFMREMEEIGD